MQPHMSLKEAEKRAFKSTHQDGLWDIFLGLLFVAFGLGPLLRYEAGLSERSGLIAHVILIIGALAFWWLCKKFITVPRMGLVRFGAERKRKLMNVRYILLGSVVLGFVAFATFASGHKIALVMVLAMFSVNILVVMGFMAHYMDFERLYGYAVLWAVSLPVGALLEDRAGLGDAGYVFFVTGGLAVIVGIVLFVRFLRDYPAPPADEMEAVNHGAT